jgi:DNA-binding NarL/FixJ family response regulator
MGTITSANAANRIMRVDDHAVMRVGLASVLSAGHGFVIVAQADDGESACALYEKHLPDVTLLDVSMDRMDGIETLCRIRSRFPDARLLMLSASKDPRDMQTAMQAGACGYLVKSVRHEELAAAIRAVHRGELLSPPAGQAAPDPPGPLSLRETEVLGLVRQGFTNDGIARLLGISERTVRWHMTCILERLNASDRAQAVARGFELGLLRVHAEKPEKQSRA